MLLPLFLALVVYGSTKYVGEGQGEGEGVGVVVGEGQGEGEVQGEGQGVGVVVGVGEGVSESISNHVERVDRVDGGESGFNAENAEGAKSGWGSSLTGLTGSAGLNDNHVNLVNPVENSQLQTSNSQLTTFNSELITPTVCDDWLKFGGFEDWIYLSPRGWSFRYGSNFVERLAVFSSGKIRLLKQGGGDAWIALSAVPVSIVPMANWGMIRSKEKRVKSEEIGVGKTGEESSSPFTLHPLLITPNSSLFWHAETPSNTLLLTWCNALLNRDTNSPVNIQAELFPSGNMLITHDLSGDLVTEYIPAPELPLADTIDEVMSRIEGGNSNAYFFADVAVGKGPAIVNVKSERETSLGDYSFVAYPDVTNRLPFLIGPKYDVECEAAFSYFSVTNTEVVVSNLTDRITSVQWPVTIDFDEGYDFGGGKMFEVTVNPPFLNGTMEFEGSMNGNMRMFSPRSSGGCGCEVSVAGGTVTVTGVCSNDTCVHEGSYVYEGYHEHIEFECEMYHDEDPDPEPDEPEPPEDENEPGVSVWFEEKAVIFEDEYENAPGETVPRRSTRTTLKCWAYGGELGGNFTVDLSGLGALKLVSGTPPSGRMLGPGEYVEFEAEYEAEKASSRENGTVAKVSFTENKTNVVYDDEDKMTVVEVKISPAVAAPENNAPGRHKYGVREKVRCSQSPFSPLLTWLDSGDGELKTLSQEVKYVCPLSSTVNPLKVFYGNVEYEPNLIVVEPNAIMARNPKSINFGRHPNQAGWVGMELELYVKPLDVSFFEIAVEEVPCNRGLHTGYFDNPYFSHMWYHTRENHAGNWVDVSLGNFFAYDNAAIADKLDQILTVDSVGNSVEDGWIDGNITWEVPFGWNEAGTSGQAEAYRTFAEGVTQEMIIFHNGRTGVRKLGNQVVRMTNDVVILNMEVVR